MKKIFTSLLAGTLAITAFAVAAQAYNGTEMANQEIMKISAYVEAVEETNLTVVGDSAPATITFSDYISFEELAAMVASYDIKLQQVQLRGLMPDGTRVTVATLVHKGMDYTENVVNQQAERGGYELVGITDVYAYIDSDLIDDLSADNQVYLVEAVAVGNGNSSTMSLGNGADESAVSFPKSLTWELEDLGLL